MRQILALLSTVLIVAAFTGCGSAQEEQDAATSSEGGRKVSLVLNWLPEAEHGGFYAAQVHGYYKEAGLDVEIIPGGVDVPTVPRVATGQSTFGVTNADDLIFGRVEGAEVVALMAPMQVSPRVIIVHEESGIQSLADLKNMTISMNAKGAFAQFIQKRFPLENVKIVPYAGNVANFLVDKNLAIQGYNISETFNARKQGARPRNLFVSEAGYNPYTSILFTSRETLSKDREMVAKFVQASVRGWEKYLEDPKQTNEHINKLNPEMGLDILQFGAEELQPMVWTDEAKEHGLGVMTDERWTSLIKAMEEIEVIEPGRVYAKDVYTTEFLPKKAP